jgi:hypothetical protein
MFTCNSAPRDTFAPRIQSEVPAWKLIGMQKERKQSKAKQKTPYMEANLLHVKGKRARLMDTLRRN